ncbi:hypothetical protein [Halochromatium salexigens]|uniref:Uncharacterized protein n=1 Tax=Halochromatium salexigens TaxID=49447 RepID=A0AAJ0UGJ3_HALSE|nr:hypothetical protein [Halochromatium salexigens]MBK5931076.1 hypothetical protein [Halochromatium salexigens]
MFNHPEITAAAIIGGCTIVASVIAALAAAIIGKQFRNQELLKSDLKEALSDIEFLLHVEKEHGEIHRENFGQSKIRVVRAKVKQAGFFWSQRFTPGRAKNLRSIM